MDVNATLGKMDNNATLGESPFLIQLNFCVSGVILIIVVVLGLITNSLTVVVLTRSSMRTSTNCFLLALAIVDNLLLVCTALIICLKELSSLYSEAVHPLICPFVYPIALVAQTCTNWITVSFTVERYIAICHPLKAGLMCSVKRARIIIYIIVLMSIAYNMTRWFEYKTDVTPSAWEHQCPANLSELPRYVNQTFAMAQTSQKYVMVHTSLGLSPIYETIYFTGLYLYVMCVIPLILLAVFNTLLIRAIRRSMRELKSMYNVAQRRENNITIMLISVVIVFFLCQVPALVYNVAYGLNKHQVLALEPYKVLSVVRNFSVTLNSAVNFILYCAFGQKFRGVFIKTFCGHKMFHRTETSINTASSSTGSRLSLKSQRTSVAVKMNDLRYSKISTVSNEDRDNNGISTV